jgi:hypothetical protein
LLAFALVPLLPAFYAAIFFAEPWALPYGLALSYPSALVLGAPLLWLLRRRGWQQWWQFALAGGVCAGPSIVLYCVVGPPPQLAAYSPLNAVYLAGWGAFAGLCFWLLLVAGIAPVSWRSLFGFDPPA